LKHQLSSNVTNVVFNISLIATIATFCCILIKVPVWTYRSIGHAQETISCTGPMLCATNMESSSVEPPCDYLKKGNHREVVSFGILYKNSVRLADELVHNDITSGDRILILGKVSPNLLFLYQAPDMRDTSVQQTWIESLRSGHLIGIVVALASHNRLKNW
jgi:hypothetical protein